MKQNSQGSTSQKSNCSKMYKIIIYSRRNNFLFGPSTMNKWKVLMRKDNKYTFY